MHLQLAAIGIRGVFQDLQMGASDLVVVGLGVVVEVGDDHAGLDEARIEIDVGVGDVLALDARQPDDFAQPQALFQFCLDLGLAPVGIAVAVDPAAFGHDPGAVAIHFDATALAHQFASLVIRLGVFGDQGGQLRIVRMLLFVAPAVEVEVHGAEVAVAIDDKIGADVAHPDVVQFGDHEGGVVAAAFGFGQAPFALATEHGDRLVFGNAAGDPAKGVLHVGREVLPDRGLCPEGDEGPLVFVPFIGHVPVAFTGRSHRLGGKAQSHGRQRAQSGSDRYLLDECSTCRHVIS
ncbi:hypothetical protein D3C84_466920 [compost metagenome]